MKSNGITKLYAELTNKERAAISFRYMAEGNEIEVDRIVASVPRFTYRCPDYEYRAWLYAFFSVWSIGAMEHWQCRSRAVAAMCGAQIQLLQKQKGSVSKFIAAQQLWESRLLALDAALEAVCEEHGIDVDAMRGLTETEAYRPVSRDLTPDSEYQERTRDNIRMLLPHAQTR
jgi:hypothetical protein